MIDDAIREATRLKASLHGMRASDALANAEILIDALERHALEDAAHALERIGDQLPHGALAGFVRVRLRHLAGLIDSMQDSTPPPTAA